MIDMAKTIIVKSDQLNGDDLISGPITIKIIAVEAGSSEQPVAISYEGDNGKPYKPNKSMRKVLVRGWGLDGQAYIGRFLTLYRHDAVKFGGQEVGGIRISHMSHIESGFSMSLNETKRSKKTHSVLVYKPNGREDDGIAAAKLGIDELKKFWGSLPPADQKQLERFLPAWKETAAAAAQPQTVIEEKPSDPPAQ